MRREFAGLAVVAVLATLSCAKPPTQSQNKENILVTLDLSVSDAAAILSVDGFTYGTVSTNQPITLQIPNGSKSLTYVITNSPIGTIQDVQPDIISASGTVAVVGSSITINNVISGTTYFAPVIANNLGSVADVGILLGSGSLTCLSPLLIGRGREEGFGLLEAQRGYGTARVSIARLLRHLSPLEFDATLRVHRELGSDLAFADVDSVRAALTRRSSARARAIAPRRRLPPRPGSS